MKRLIKDDVKADYAIFGEPSGVDRVTVAYKGSLHLKLDVETATGHSSSPWLFENAIDRAFEVYGILSRISFPSERVDSKFYSLTSCLTKMEGGSSSSKVPSRCSFQVDFRLPPSIATEQLRKEVEQTIRKYGESRPGVAVRAISIDACEPYESNTASPLVRSLSWAIRMVRNKPATWVRKTGTGDMNLYGKSMRIPVVSYGAGNSGLDHTSGEYVDLNDYEDSILVLRKGIIRLIDLHKKKR